MVAGQSILSRRATTRPEIQVVCLPATALMKLVVQPVPYVIKGDATGKITGRTWDDAKEPFADYIIDQITQDYIPEFRNKILKRVVHSPKDIETLIPSAPRGTITHGAFVPYQSGSMRPIPEMGNYRSPISNVYLCGLRQSPGSGGDHGTWKKRSPGHPIPISISISPRPTRRNNTLSSPMGQ